MKNKKLLWMVVSLLLLFFMASCSSNKSADSGLDAEDEILAEVEEGIDDDFGDDDEDVSDEGLDEDLGEVADSEDVEFDDSEFDEGSEDSDEVADSDDFEGEEDFSDEDFSEGDSTEVADSEFGEDDFSEEEFDGTDGESDEFSEDEFAGEGVESEAVVEVAPTPDTEVVEPEIEDTTFSEPVATATSGFGDTVIESIDFKAGSGTTGIIEIKSTGEVQYEIRQKASNNQLVVDIDGATIDRSLERPFIMKDFNSTPFAGLNAYRYENGLGVSIVVQMKPGNPLPLVQQEGNTLLVMADSGVSTVIADNEGGESNFQPSSAGQFEDKGIMSATNFHEFLMSNQKYYGKPISIQADNANIRDLLYFISDESGANIIVSKEVKGKASLKLRGVPWDQVLVTLMKSNSLGYIREGNVLRISTMVELEKDAQKLFDTKQKIDRYRPKKLKVFSVNYAEIVELEQKLTMLLTKDFGNIRSDSRTNSIIVSDTDETITKIGALIQQLDKPPAQVMIEGKIVEAQENFISQVGVNWGLRNGVSVLDKLGGAFGGPIELRPSFSVQPSQTDAISGALGGFASLSVGTLKNIGDLNASLALSERDNLTKIISSPRIIAMNKEEAEIEQSSEVLTITSVTQDNTVSQSVQRTPVELKMKITPQITNSKTILMDFEVSREFPGAEEDSSTLARAVNGRSAKSKILVKNGETAVIGGIYDSLGFNSEAGLKGLKNIPVLGWLFKSKQKEQRKNELLIFLTPKILDKG